MRTISLAVGLTFWLTGSLGRAAPPRVNYLFPAGAARDSAVTITTAGNFERWPAKAWIDSASLSLTPESDKGRWKLTVARDAAAGIYWVRCLDEEGASTPVPFVVGTLPEVVEQEPNDEPRQAQRVAGPVTMNGRLARSGDVDSFAVELHAGQTLVASVQAHTVLGSPMDTVLQIGWLDRRGVADGEPLDGDVFVVGQTDDSVGYDPRLALTVPRDGTYLVRVFAFPVEPNSTVGFAGADNFVYRLTMTTAGFIDHVRPLAIQPDRPTVFEICGWNIPESLRTLTVTASGGWNTYSVFHPELASTATVAVVTRTVDERQGDNKRVPIDPPATFTGRLEQPRQCDTYHFRASKERKLRFRVESRSLGFATDPELAVTDDSGNRLAYNDDISSNRDPELVFTPPADGDYQLRVRDVFGHGDFRNVYRLTITEVVPDFAIALASDSVVLETGKTVEVSVAIDRRERFSDDIEITAEDLPKGVAAARVTSKKDGATAKSVKLVLSADGNAEPIAGPLLIRGISASESLVRIAEYRLKSQNASRSDLFLTLKRSQGSP